MSSEKHKILVVDDHPLPCSGICAAIEALHSDYRAVGVHTAAAARAALQGGGPWKMALCDVNLPDVDGLELALEIRVQHRLPVLIITGQSDPITMSAAAKSGAAGFWEKSADSETFKIALRTVLAGGRYFSHEGLVKAPDVEPAAMTHRQRQILDLMLAGTPNKAIATALGLGDGTVRNHISDLLTLFSITSRSRGELVAKATRLGYKPPRHA